MRSPAAKDAALAAFLVLSAVGRCAAQIAAQQLDLGSGFEAASTPGILAPRDLTATPSLQAPILSSLRLSAALTSLLPAAPAVWTAPAAAPQRRGGLLGRDHASALFAAIPDFSHLDSAASKQTAETDFVARLGGDSAAPADSEPQLQKAAALSLRTTQMAAGMKEVDHKTDKLLALKQDAHELKHYLKSNPVPVVIGPGGRMYIIDHHHLVRAAWASGVSEVYVEIRSDLSDLPESAFWKRMSEEHWVYPYDHDGKLHDVRDLPQDVRGLEDNPYRSVAWAVREQEGFQKTDAPFMEFKWADFFRARLKTDPRHRGFEAAVSEALALAKSPEAKLLPGYTGPR